MGVFRGSRGYKYHDGRLPFKIQKSSTSFGGPSPKCHNFRGCVLPTGILHPKLAGIGRRERDHFSATSFLFSALHPSQEKRQVTPCHRPVGTERSSCGSDLQNGNGGSHLPFHLGDSLGLLHRHRGRLLPRADRMGISQVPCVQAQRSDLRVPVPPVRPVIGSLGIFSGHKADKAPLAHSPDSDLQLSGRLSNPGSFSGGTPLGHRGGSRSSSSSGIQDQLGEVKSPSFSVNRVPGCDMGLTEGGFVCPTRQTVDGQNPLLGDVPQERYHQERDGKPYRSVEFCGNLYCSGKASSTSHSDVVESPHSTLHQGCPCSSGWEGQGTSGLLDKPGVPASPCSHARPSTVSHRDDGCLLGGLVRDSSASQDHGPMALKRLGVLYELEGADGYSADSDGFSISAQGKNGASAVRQYDSDFLPPSPGVGEACSPSFSDFGDSHVLQKSVNSLDSRTPEGGSECVGGPGLSSPPHSNGMVPGQRDIPLDLWAGPTFPDRPLCNEGERPAQSVCVPLPGRPGSGVRCFQPELESLDLHLPDASRKLPSGGRITPPRVSGNGDPRGSPLAIEGMVSSPPSTLQGESSSSSGESSDASAHFERSSDPQQSEFLAASRLEALNAPWLKMGLSEDSVHIVQNTHRKSTQRQYQSIWKKFLLFLSQHNVSHSDVTVYVVMNFLSHQFIHLGRAYRTVAAYKCALAHPLWTNFGIPLDDPALELYMRGVFNLHPPRPADMPSWSLEMLLEFLTSEHFEPLHSKGLIPVTQKTLCLVLLASGRRIDEVAHLSKFHVFDRDGESVTIHWLPRYKPKHYDKAFQPRFPSFDRLASDSEADLLLCPVRALNTYLGMVRGGPRYSLNAPLWSQTCKGLSGLFKSTVLQARHHAGITDDFSVGPHQMRKLAASYSARMIGSSASGEGRLMDRMGCASMTVLKRTYINNVPELGFKVVLPSGTFIPGVHNVN